MKNLTLSDFLSGEGVTSFERIIEATTVSFEAQNVWESIENYFMDQYLSTDKIGEVEVAINIQNNEKVFINFGCRSNTEKETNMSMADALDIIKLASINGLNTSVFFPSISLREWEEPETLICSITLLFSI